MKIKILSLITIIIISLTVISSFSVIGLNQNYPKYSSYDYNGRIHGTAEMQGKCMEIPVPGLKIGCGRNFRNYKTDVTDDNGIFEFNNLYYDGNRGTTYYVWVLPGQNIIFPLIKKVTLKQTNPEEYVYIWVTGWWPWSFENYEMVQQQIKRVAFL
jgi:hypothetical protein